MKIYNRHFFVILWGISHFWNFALHFIGRKKNCTVKFWNSVQTVLLKLDQKHGLLSSMWGNGNQSAFHKRYRYTGSFCIQRPKKMKSLHVYVSNSSISATESGTIDLTTSFMNVVPFQWLADCQHMDQNMNEVKKMLLHNMYVRVLVLPGDKKPDSSCS